MNLTAQQLQNFWSKVDKDGPVPEHQPDLGPCWVWQANVQSKGYGTFWIDGKTHTAHRVSYAIAHGEMPMLQVLHTCDNRRCVNPDHLWLGTPCDNVTDMIAKGRANLSGLKHVGTRYQ